MRCQRANARRRALFPCRALSASLSHVTTTSTPSIVRDFAWLRRSRSLLALAWLWAILRFLVPRDGYHQPIALAAGKPLYAGLLAILLLSAGVWVASRIVSKRTFRHLLGLTAAALLLWSLDGGASWLAGQMDQWLRDRHASAAPPTGGPYGLLLADYAYLLVPILACAAFGGLAAPRENLVRNLGAREPLGRVSTGLLALLITTSVGGALVLLLSGSAIEATYRQQAIFAVAAGCATGTYVATHVTKTTHIAWYWPAPLLMGVVGLAVAGVRPALALPPAYAHLDTMPAWGLARAMPIEMVGAGLLGIIWVLRGVTAHDERASAGHG